MKPHLRLHCKVAIGWRGGFMWWLSTRHGDCSGVWWAPQICIREAARFYPPQPEKPA